MSVAGISYYEFTDKALALVNKKTIAKITVIARIAFWVLSLILALFTLWYVITTLIVTPAEILEVENNLAQIGVIQQAKDKSNENVADSEIAVLAKTGMFGDFTVEKAAPAEKKAEKKSELNLALIGTFISGDSSQAIIEEKKKKSQEVFLTGEDIFDQAKLLKIFPNKVEIEHNGQTEYLIIDESQGDGGDEGSSDADDQFVIDEGELNEALDNLPLLLTQARAVPYFKNGKAIGLRLFAIKTGSMYEKIGLKNGDILKAINENSLADMSQAMKLFEKLREERSLQVVLERNRKEMSFKYSIK